jgi:hypothetical protein
MLWYRWWWHWDMRKTHVWYPFVIFYQHYLCNLHTCKAIYFKVVYTLKTLWFQFLQSSSASYLWTSILLYMPACASFYHAENLKFEDAACIDLVGVQ